MPLLLLSRSIVPVDTCAVPDLSLGASANRWDLQKKKKKLIQIFVKQNNNDSKELKNNQRSINEHF